jgi:ribonuclease HI
MIDVLFILKKRIPNLNDPDAWNYVYSSCQSSGLYNSVCFIDTMLQNNNIRSDMIEVTDNNNIDYFVTKFKPKIVIIEALWVVPSKFKTLKKLHPTVKWVVRLHSEIPFLAQEGIALQWLKEYEKEDVIISSNSERVVSAFKGILKNEIFYLPNFYEIKSVNTFNKNYHSDEVNISCFGAIRPFKNHLTQAIAAMKVADHNKIKLNFHVNASRKEQHGENVYKNLDALFLNTPHTLVKVPWLCHDNFLTYIKEHIDIGMQVSFTETFCIVAADHIACNVPILTSPEVKFVTSFYHADPTDVVDIASKLNRIYTFNFAGAILNKQKLKSSNALSRKVWLNFVEDLNEA